MSISSEDVLVPHGPIDAAMFPGVPSNVLPDTIDEYIDAAYADTRVSGAASEKQDRLAFLLTCYNVLQGIYVRMNLQPLDLTVTEKGAHSYDMKQLENIRQLAAGYLAQFLELTQTVIVSTRKVNVAAPNVFGF